jgi:hypothetical protein
VNSNITQQLKQSRDLQDPMQNSEISSNSQSVFTPSVQIGNLDNEFTPQTVRVPVVNLEQELEHEFITERHIVELPLTSESQIVELPSTSSVSLEVQKQYFSLNLPHKLLN